MIIIRVIVAAFISAILLSMLTMAVVGAGILTVYQGLVHNDWMEDKWDELPGMIKEFYDKGKDFVLNG